MPAGRPLKYSDPKILQDAINNYFNNCDNTIINKQVVQKGQIIIVPTPTPYTIAGIARALDVDRSTILNYTDKPEFLPIIAQARSKIEESNLTLGLVGCHDSRLSALNLASNYGYSEKRELELTPGGLLAEYMSMAIGLGRKILLEQGDDAILVEGEEE